MKLTSAVAKASFLTRLATVQRPPELSADMAIRFEKKFGFKVEALMRMKAAHEDEIEVERVAA